MSKLYLRNIGAVLMGTLAFQLIPAMCLLILALGIFVISQA